MNKPLLNMLNKISKTHALIIILGLLTAVVIFHALIIIGIIPYEIVWAGKLKSVSEMYVFEIVSIIVNMLLLIVLLLKGNFLKHTINEKIINGILWVFVLVFGLNTIGNLFAKSLFEKAVFTPLTLILALLIWIILRKDKTNKPLE
jgi:hypothetical protein